MEAKLHCKIERGDALTKPIDMVNGTCVKGLATHTGIYVGNDRVVEVNN